MNPEEPIREYAGDRLFTYQATFIALAIGVALAAIIGLLLLSLRQPLVTTTSGGIIWSFGMFMLPLAGLLTVIILAWSVFRLPVVLARRRGIILDPNVWPWTGAVAVAVLVIAAFSVAILLGVI